ncbi:EAF family [Phytophthora cactorum]|nr:EAF family [Phytophthora cactorum]
MASDEDEAPPPAPLDECEYPVVLGRSLTDGKEEQGDVYASFGYEFQPASVDKSTPGLVSVDGSSGVQVLMGSSTGGVIFKGKMMENKETDCLLIFDGSGFRLERCPFSCLQLRHVRAPTPPRRVKIQAEQASGTVGAGSTLATSRTDKRPVGRPKGFHNKRPVSTDAPTVKRSRGRPKGSTKAAIAAKKARLEAQQMYDHDERLRGAPYGRDQDQRPRSQVPRTERQSPVRRRLLEDPRDAAQRLPFQVPFHWLREPHVPPQCRRNLLCRVDYQIGICVPGRDQPNVEPNVGENAQDLVTTEWPDPVASCVLRAGQHFRHVHPQLLRYPNPSDPLNGEAASLLMKDAESYNRKVKEYVRNYASQPIEMGNEEEDSDVSDMSDIE